MKLLPEPFHCFSFSVLSAGLAWAFFPRRNNLAGIMASRPGQNTDLTNSGKAKWLCTQQSQESRTVFSHSLAVGKRGWWDMPRAEPCTLHMDTTGYSGCSAGYGCKPGAAPVSSSAVLPEMPGLIRLGLKRWPSFIPTTGMNSALKVKCETTCRSAF